MFSVALLHGKLLQGCLEVMFMAESQRFYLFFIFRKHMYMRFVLKCVPGLDCLRYDYMSFAFAFGHFFERVLILLSCMSPCLLVVHLSSRPMMKSSITFVVIFLPLREVYACKVCSLYAAATI